MDLLTVIWYVIAIMAAGVVVGAVVQRITHFLLPFDFLTLAIAGVILYHLFVRPIVSVEWYWFIPFICGYFLGWFVSGKSDYVMVRQFSDAKVSTGTPWVIYYKDKNACRQVQSNWALFKRLFFGLHNQIVCPGGALPVEPDWMEVSKYPYIPAFKKKTIMAEDFYEVGVDDEDKPRWKPAAKATILNLAPGSMMGRVDIIRNVRAVDEANASIIRANNEIFQLRQGADTRMADSITRFLAAVYSKAPGAAFNETIKRWQEKTGAVQDTEGEIEDA